MHLHLVRKGRWSIPVQVDDRLEEALDVQWDRSCREDFDLAFFVRLSACLESSLVECLDSDLQLPTDGQVRYTMAIARELGVSLPAEALRFRGATHEFISRFEGAFRASRERHRHAARPPDE